MALFSKKKQVTTNTSTSFNVVGGDSGPPIVANNSTVSLTDQGSVEKAVGLSMDAIDFGRDAIDAVASVGRETAASSALAVGDAIQLAMKRSQSEGSQQSESLIRLATIGTVVVGGVFAVWRVFA